MGFQCSWSRRNLTKRGTIQSLGLSMMRECWRHGRIIAARLQTVAYWMLEGDEADSKRST